VSVYQIIILSSQERMGSLFELDNNIAWFVPFGLISLLSVSESGVLREPRLDLDLHLKLNCASSFTIMKKLLLLISGLLEAAVVELLESAFKGYNDVLRGREEVIMGCSEGVQKHGAVLILAIIFKLLGERIYCAKDALINLKSITSVSVATNNATTWGGDSFLKTEFTILVEPSLSFH